MSEMDTLLFIHIHRLNHVQHGNNFHCSLSTLSLTVAYVCRNTIAQLSPTLIVVRLWWQIRLDMVVYGDHGTGSHQQKMINIVSEYATIMQSITETNPTNSSTMTLRVVGTKLQTGLSIIVSICMCCSKSSNPLFLCFHFSIYQMSLTNLQSRFRCSLV